MFLGKKLVAGGLLGEQVIFLVIFQNISAFIANQACFYVGDLTGGLVFFITGIIDLPVGNGMHRVEALGIYGTDLAGLNNDLHTIVYPAPPDGIGQAFKAVTGVLFCIYQHNKAAPAPDEFIKAHVIKMAAIRQANKPRINVGTAHKVADQVGHARSRVGILVGLTAAPEMAMAVPIMGPFS